MATRAGTPAVFAPQSVTWPEWRPVKWVTRIAAEKANPTSTPSQNCGRRGNPKTGAGGGRQPRARCERLIDLSLNGGRATHPTPGCNEAPASNPLPDSIRHLLLTVAVQIGERWTAGSLSKTRTDPVEWGGRVGRPIREEVRHADIPRGRSTSARPVPVSERNDSEARGGGWPSDAGARREPWRQHPGDLCADDEPSGVRGCRG